MGFNVKICLVVLLGAKLSFGADDILVPQAKVNKHESSPPVKSETFHGKTRASALAEDVSGVMQSVSQLHDHEIRKFYNGLIELKSANQRKKLVAPTSMVELGRKNEPEETPPSEFTRGTVEDLKPTIQQNLQTLKQENRWHDVQDLLKSIQSRKQ